MNEKGITRSCMVITNEKSSSLYRMLFGVLLALFSFNRADISNEMLHGGASLIGLLIWKIQREEQVKSEKRELLNKLENAELKIEELKSRRVEDAKANEKVVGIFAAHEQRWLMERKKLTQQNRLLLDQLQASSTKRDEYVSKVHSQLDEKDKLLDEEKRKRIDQEEAVKKSEKINEELREALKREAHEHSKEIWKHKSAFIELVSAQRQLEAEMGRAVRQVEAEKQELDAVLEQKEQYVLMSQKLSMELIKTRKDLEQKDKILSAMLRKSNLNTAEKQELMKEVKLSKKPNGSRYERYSLRSMLSRHYKSKPEVSADVKAVPPVSASPSHTRSQPSNLLEYDHSEASEELVLAADIRQLEGWVQSETEKYVNVMEQRHELEVNAFAEQLRLKDEKVEAFRWHSVSMDIELKRFQSHIEGLTRELTNLKQQNLKTEALLLDRESELHALKAHKESVSRLTASKSQKCIKQTENVFKDSLQTVQSPDKEFEDKNDVSLDPKNDTQSFENMPSSTWKMDLHALGVFYKIKRLKQQLLMFERLTGKQETCENSQDGDKKQFYSLVSLVNKQINRYQSLQEKANDICKRIYENDQDTSSAGAISAKTNDETKKLEHFLEETFQLQRYIVATGQKLIEIQTKIASGFVGVSDDGLNGRFDTKKFADCLPTLFREVQRGLEVRISRTIGDLEGPLARDGMIHPRS